MMTRSHSKPRLVLQPAPPAASVGDRLRLQREQLGWSLEEVAAWLRIKPVHLQALEDGRPQDLPGHTYAVGFLRSYASSLGLDPHELLQYFRDENAGPEPLQELHFPAPVPERGVPPGAAVLIGVLLLGLVYTGWYWFAGHEKLPIQSVPPLPAGMIPYASALPLAPPAIPPGPALAPPVPDLRALPVPGLRVLPVPGVATAAAANTQPAALPPTAAAPAAASAAPVSIKASASSWVQVRQQDGPVVYEHILQPGDSWSVPAASGRLLLSVGNAGGITLSAGGFTTAPLGPDGAVRRNLSLEPDAIRDDIRPVGMNQTGQTPPLLAGSDRDATPPAPNLGQDDPGHNDIVHDHRGHDGGQSNPEH